jgi:hypothetical protein
MKKFSTYLYIRKCKSNYIKITSKHCQNNTVKQVRNSGEVWEQGMLDRLLELVH